MGTAAYLYAYVLLAALADNAAVLALIGTIVAALIGGAVAIHNLRQTLNAQREANASAEQARVQAAAAEANALQAQQAAQALELALTSQNNMISNLQRDNDRLRTATGNCEHECAQLRIEYRQALDDLSAERRETAELRDRVEHLERQVEEMGQR